jgi:cholesterol 7-dehydrogenase
MTYDVQRMLGAALSVDIIVSVVLLFVFYRLARYLYQLLVVEFDDNWPIEDTTLFGKNRKAGKTPPFYPNGWYKVCNSDEVPAGTNKNFEILGQNLVVFRGEDGIASILDAYCPHLGANMGVTGTVKGTVKGNCIEVSKRIFNTHK